MSNEHDPPIFVGPTEAARLLGISRSHVHELVAREEIPYKRLGRRIVIPRAWIVQQAEECTAPPVARLVGRRRAG